MQQWHLRERHALDVQTRVTCDFHVRLVCKQQVQLKVGERKAKPPRKEERYHIGEDQVHAVLRKCRQRARMKMHVVPLVDVLVQPRNAVARPVNHEVEEVKRDLKEQRFGDKHDELDQKRLPVQTALYGSSSLLCKPERRALDGHHDPQDAEVDGSDLLVRELHSLFAVNLRLLVAIHSNHLIIATIRSKLTL